MDETMQLGLPLVQPAQAQKHVTVNEALVRLDGLTHLVLQSVDTATPPNSGTDGETWAVPAGAVNAWDGQDGKIAIRSNGGWVFVPPQAGWRGWIADRQAGAIFDGQGWAEGAVAVSQNRAVSAIRVLEFDHDITPGATSTTAVAIPRFAMVFAVTARVRTAFGGAVTSWSLGVAGAPDRYGSGLGCGAASWVSGITGQPVTYYADTALLLSAAGGDFASGSVRVAVHYYSATPPEV